MNRRDTLCDYFDEDVVIKRSSNGKLLFGLVVESSENATDSEESDSDDSDDNNRSIGDKWRQLRPGFTKIALYPNGNTVVVNESKVKLYDRSLLSGDVVQRLDPKTHKLEPNGEHGFCKSTKILATLKILGTDRVIENVDSSHLQMLSHISEDTICLLDSWLGYVKEVNQKVVLKCRDGSLLTAHDLDISEFVDLLTQRENKDSEFNRDDYYIGQQLYGPKKDLKGAKWVTQSDRMKRFMNSNSIRNSKINVVVEDVFIDSVAINWLCCLSDESLSKNKSKNCDSLNGQKNLIRNQSQNSSLNITSHPNGDLIRGEDIKRIKCLNYFGKCSLQIGHQCYYTIRPNDSVIKWSDWLTNESMKLAQQEMSANDVNEVLPEEDLCLHSDNESSFESIDNSSKKRCLSESLSLSSIETNKSKTKKKVLKTKSHFLSLSLNRVKRKKLFSSHRKRPYLLPIATTAGARLPVEIVATNTRVTVVWQNSSIEDDIPSVCLYPVHHIDNHDFFPGDYVVENKDISETFDYGVVQRCDAIARTAAVKWFSMDPNSQTAHSVAQQELSVYDIKDHPDFRFRSGVCVVRILTSDSDQENCEPLSRAGQVIDLTLDGMLECVWLNRQKSLVCPQHLFVVGDYDSDDLWGDSGSEYDYSDYSYPESNAESWETDDENVGANANTNTNTNGTKKVSKSNPKTIYYQSLLKLLHNGTSQLESWLSNGSGNCRNGLENVLKLMRRAETSLDKCKEGNDSSQKQLSNYSNKLQQLSKRLVQLLPFSQSSQPSPVDNHRNGNEETNDSEKSSELASSSNSNVNTFLDLIDDLKTEILKNETQSQTTNGDSIDHNLEDNSSKSEAIEVNPNSHTNGSTEVMPINGSVIESKGNVIFLDTVPESHKYYHSMSESKGLKDLLKRIKFEISLLSSALPEGIDVALFHDRIDLLSVLVFGPKGTPYEDGLFAFDIQLPANYPSVPPLVHYISYCSDRLNPNLYESGKVCISLLGTWSGKGTEVWTPNASNLLQLIVSIQGLILVAEPYYNEAGYGRQRGTAIANENSRLYNEMVVIKLIQSMTKMLVKPPKAFETPIREHISRIANKFIERHENWAKMSQMCASAVITSAEPLPLDPTLPALPPFPLLPASHGFCLSLNKAILLFKETLKSIQI